MSFTVHSLLLIVSAKFISGRKHDVSELLVIEVFVLTEAIIK